MEITVTRFLFHPFHEEHTVCQKTTSVITNIALAAMTAGLYLVGFALFHLFEWSSVKQLSLNEAIPIPAPLQAINETKAQRVKAKQADHLAKLTALARNDGWQHIQRHTNRSESGFDWWMFPTDRPSAGFGDHYQVNAADIQTLRLDPVFMKSYRAGVILVAASWGWDLDQLTDLTNHSLRWTNYQVRLGKMLDSLRLFGQDDLRLAITHFVDLKGIRFTLEPWIQNLLL
jgi:hypothetical protein